jgi:hypothetical protein
MEQHFGWIMAAVLSWMTFLVGVAGYFVRRWMAVVENRGITNAANIEANHEITKKRLAEFTAQTTQELKNAIHENRDEYRRSSSEIKDSIDKLSAHVATANGRTGKLEERIAVQIALCKQRNEGRRSNDSCERTD